METMDMKYSIMPYFHFPNTPSWYNAQLKHWDIFTSNINTPINYA